MEALIDETEVDLANLHLEPTDEIDSSKSSNRSRYLNPERVTWTPEQAMVGGYFTDLPLHREFLVFTHRPMFRTAIISLV